MTRGAFQRSTPPEAAAILPITRKMAANWFDAIATLAVCNATWRAWPTIFAPRSTEGALVGRDDAKETRRREVFAGAFIRAGKAQ